MPTWIKQFRLSLRLILVAFLLWLFYLALVPSGRITYNYAFTKPSDFIGVLAPADRVEKPNSGTQKIIGNPVYFSLRTARPFDRAKVTITYQNPHALSNIEAGVLVDKALWRYDTKPLANHLIDQAIASGAWGLLEDGSTLLLQKSENYNSIQEFLAKLPAKNQVALYNYDLASNYRLTNYQATSTPLVWSQPLKGNYQFYTYLKQEALALDFSFTDLNENKDPDPVEVSLYDELGNLVATKSLADDALATGSSKTRSLNFQQAALAEGVYKVEVKANSDIITERISGNLSRLAFINRLWLAASSKPINLYARGAALSFQTINPASRSLIYMNQEVIDLGQTYRQFSSTGDCGELCQLKLPVGDVIIAGDAVFSLRADQLLEPRFTKLASRSTIPAGVKYILASYTKPKANTGWQEATVDLDLSQAYREQGKYSLLLSIPSLSAEDEVKDSLLIKNIQVELVGKDWRALLRRCSGQVAKLLGK